MVKEYSVELWDMITEEDKKNGYPPEDFMIKVYDKNTRHIEAGTDLMYTLIDKTPQLKKNVKPSEVGTFAFVIPEIGWQWTVFNRFYNVSVGSWCFLGIVRGFEAEEGYFSLDELFKLCMKKDLDMYIVSNA